MSRRVDGDHDLGLDVLGGLGSRNAPPPAPPPRRSPPPPPPPVRPTPPSSGGVTLKDANVPAPAPPPSSPWTAVLTPQAAAATAAAAPPPPANPVAKFTPGTGVTPIPGAPPAKGGAPGGPVGTGTATVNAPPPASSASPGILTPTPIMPTVAPGSQGPNPAVLPNGQPNLAYSPPTYPNSPTLQNGQPNPAYSAPDPNKPGFLLNGQPDPNYNPYGNAPFNPGAGGYGGGGGGGGYDDGGSSGGGYGGGGGGYGDPFADGGGDPFADVDPYSDPYASADDFAPQYTAADVASLNDDGSGQMADGGDQPIDSGGYTAADRAALEDDSVQGLSFEWQDIFNPAGAGIRAYEESNKHDATSASFQAPQTAQQQAQAGGSTAAKPSPALAQSLADSKRRLAALQLAELALRASQLTQAQAQAAALQASATPSDSVSGDGALFSQVNDIHVTPWTSQITDQRPDPLRIHGSAHRGVAYLQEYAYPVGGASSGQEGGVMRPDQNVVISGCHDKGLDVLGAAVVAPRGPAIPRAGFTFKPTPGGNRHVSLVLMQPKRGDHKASIKNARDAGNRAVSIGTKLQDTLKKTTIHGAPPAQSRVAAVKLQQVAKQAIKVGKDTLKAADKHEKLISNIAAQQRAGLQKASAAMRGTGGGEHPPAPGAAGPSTPTNRKPPVVKRPAQSHRLAGDEQTDDYVSIDGDRPTDTHVFIDGDNDLFVTDDTSVARAILEGEGGYGEGVVDETAESLIYGCDHVILGAYLDVLGDAAPVDPNNPPDPNNPGFLLDGSPDPNYAGAAGGTPGAGAFAPGTSPSSTGDASNNYGLGPAPTTAPPLQPGVDYMPDPYASDGGASDPSVYSSTDPSLSPVPQGAVYYDGSHKMPTSGVGSVTRFAGGARDGGGNSGFEWHDDGWYWYWDQAYNVGPTDLRFKHDDTYPSMKARSTASIQHGWGPLIGNPTGQSAQTPGMASFPIDGWVKGLRLDVDANGGQGGWFWYYDQAPAWATANGPNGSVARLNQAILDYKAQYAAAAADAAAQAAQDKLDAQNAAALAKQQAAEDAATARSQQQELTAQQHQADLQAVADQQAAAQAQQQSQLDFQAQQQAQQLQVQQWQAQAQIDQQAAQQQAQLEAQAAETAARIQQQYPDAYVPGYSDYDPTAAAAPPDGGDDMATAPQSWDDAKAMLDDNQDSSAIEGAVDRMRKRSAQRRSR